MVGVDNPPAEQESRSLGRVGSRESMEAHLRQAPRYDVKRRITIPRDDDEGAAFFADKARRLRRSHQTNR